MAGQKRGAIGHLSGKDPVQANKEKRRYIVASWWLIIVNLFILYQETCNLLSVLSADSLVWQNVRNHFFLVENKVQCATSNLPCNMTSGRKDGCFLAVFLTEV
jgi:hypothetical protein